MRFILCNYFESFMAKDLTISYANYLYPSHIIIRFLFRGVILVGGALAAIITAKAPPTKRHNSICENSNNIFSLILYT